MVKKYFYSMVLFVSGMIPATVFASTETNPSKVLNNFIGGKDVLGTGRSSVTPGFGAPQSPAQVVGNVLSILYGFLGVIALLLIIYAGVTWLFAAGNQDKIQRAVGILKSAVIGLVVLFSAYLLTAFIIRVIGGV